MNKKAFHLLAEFMFTCEQPDFSAFTRIDKHKDSRVHDAAKYCKNEFNIQTNKELIEVAGEELYNAWRLTGGMHKIPYFTSREYLEDKINFVLILAEADQFTNQHIFKNLIDD